MLCAYIPPCLSLPILPETERLFSSRCFWHVSAHYMYGSECLVC